MLWTGYARILRREFKRFAKSSPRNIFPKGLTSLQYKKLKRELLQVDCGIGTIVSEFVNQRVWTPMSTKQECA
jgi:hypothetical protein